MNSERLPGPYGPYFDLLHSPPNWRGRYLEAMKRQYPALAEHAVAGPGNEGTVYVYIPLPATMS
jgi:hypothetical protein